MLFVIFIILGLLLTISWLTLTGIALGVAIGLFGGAMAIILLIYIWAFIALWMLYS